MNYTGSYSNNSNANTKEIISSIIETEIQEIIEQNKLFSCYDCTSKLYRINNFNRDILFNETFNEDKYYKNPGSYLRYVIEEYCSLPFIERERIYRQDIYNIVDQACKNKNVLKVKTRINSTDQTVYVYPYRLVPDSYHTQSYLTCYVESNNNISNSRIASFSMARLNVPKILKQTFSLTPQQISNIELRLKNNSAAYLIEDSEQIHIHLTEKGKQFYRNKLFSRPVKIESLSNDNVYVFNCSKRQIFNYFYNFGKEAQIISPGSLRNQFINAYKKAYKSYERSV